MERSVLGRCRVAGEEGAFQTEAGLTEDGGVGGRGFLQGSVKLGTAECDPSDEGLAGDEVVHSGVPEKAPSGSYVEDGECGSESPRQPQALLGVLPPCTQATVGSWVLSGQNCLPSQATDGLALAKAGVTPCTHLRLGFLARSLLLGSTSPDSGVRCVCVHVTAWSFSVSETLCFSWLFASLVCGSCPEAIVKLSPWW